MKRVLLREIKKVEINDPSKFNPDSEEACFGKDNTGPEENDVIVGKFIWHREKSNSNLDDTGDNKGGFSFYYARRIYDDDYFYYIPIRKNKKTVIPGRGHGVGRLPQPDNSPLLTIDMKEEIQGKKYIRIISARYTNKAEVEMYEYNKEMKQIREELKREKYYEKSLIRFQEVVSKRKIIK
ncbi:MAG: hypothetical protein LBG43_01930 [Treponema sp.]|jgi:uncharacterized DUF497 family protein|nr:hypothetical protein [Treponema sp.]